MEVSVGQADHHSGLLGLMSGLVTGTALQVIVAPTTSPVALAASSVVPSKMSPPAASTAMALGQEAQSGSVEAAARHGNPVTGCVLGLAAMSTILLAGWSASDAMRLGTLKVPVKGARISIAFKGNLSMAHNIQSFGFNQGK
ncbi:hypothetical protein CKAN_00156200 [Cinnamomum micranthum f. kanehirae]|uniref:Uncharacterized protein n=1 Tax=Cinnamomum micranthum f. kanehirae TaxID=337451 RepID=A0A443N453_9MAGN|nr:hypothetical protein CKAN_00156200 [Cinnamomum micranthum f. kanehirae]